MKLTKILSKGLILVVLVAVPLFSNGCSLFGGDEELAIIDESQQEKRVGVLKSLGGISIGEATHLLEAKGGHTIRLRSLNINLDQEKYINKIVEVRGVMSKATDSKEIMDVISIDSVEDESDNTTLNGQEKEYKNADLGFMLTYLDSWTIEENETEVIFTAAVPIVVTDADEEVDEELSEDEIIPDRIIISKEDNPNKLTVEAYLGLPSDADDLITSGYTKSLVGVDQLEGLKKESPDKMEIDIWLDRNDSVYQLTFIGADNKDTSNNKNAFFTMVSKFKLIGFTPDEETTEEGDDDEITLPDTETPDVTPYEPEEESIPVIEKPVIIVPEIEEPEAPVVSSSSFGVIANYIGETINSVAPESSDSGSWSATNFEFVDPNYVYVDYNDGSDNRRVLLTYNQDNGLTTDVIGYFEPGETTSWVRVDGENPVETAEKTIINITDEGAEETATIKEGYRYFESLPYDFNAQYPSNWYFSGSGGADGVIHHYGFSNEPVEDGNELVSIDIVTGSVPAGSPISVGTHSGIKVISGGTTSIYIEREDGKLYKVHGDSTSESFIVDIASSINEI